MKQFLKFLLASVMGFFLAMFLISMVGVGWLASMTQKEDVKVEPNSILKATLSSEILEMAPSSPMANFDPQTLKPRKALGLHDILAALKNAKIDDRIKGIYLELSSVNAGFATVEEIRNALLDFKESGKFLIVYSEFMTQKTYYLASVADKIFLNPVGALELKGFSSRLSFFKKGMDELGIEPQITWAGNFKSATEPFRLTQMSEDNRLQVRAILDDFYQIFIDRISTSRDITRSELHRIVDSLEVRRPEDAKRLKLVDDLLYIDQVQEVLAQNLDLEEEEEPIFIKLSKYAEVEPLEEIDYKAGKIAVVVAQGNITGGPGKSNSIGSDDYVKILQEVRKDENIEAVVFRINSGGGSALASEIMLREVQLLRKAGKPVVASMGDVAASGGYYIACDSDKIFAEENTVTGSIGVFALMANAGPFFEDRLGITTDTVKTTKYSDFPTTPLLRKALSSDEQQIMQEGVDHIYDTFLSRVSEGRGLAKDSVRSLAAGRVWSGRQALAVGLVDQIGGVGDAIVEAAALSKMDSYRVTIYPEKEDPLAKLLAELTGKEVPEAMIREQFPELCELYDDLSSLQEMKGPQMRMPFRMEIE